MNSINTGTLSFAEFRREHPLYDAALDRLDAANRLLAISAQLVYELYPAELGPVVNNILSFLQQTCSYDYIGSYIARVDKITRLQERFDANPSASTLGDGTVVPTSDYCLSLLLSLIFTNHRFEILRMLERFLRDLSQRPTGRIASIGCGTGYELKLASDLLPGWDIEGYDIDATMRAEAQKCLQFFRVPPRVRFGEAFPMQEPTTEVLKRYDAIILCEVLEHLQQPARALSALRECLSDAGLLFVTMAINLAQEDHVYLYPNVEVCRNQIQESGLAVQSEWLAPQTIRFPPPNREAGFRKGNYVAIVASRNPSQRT